MISTSRGRYDKKVGLLQVMQDSIHSNITQCQFDFNALAIAPVPNLAEIGIEITPIPETQEYWWNELEYKHIPRKSGIYAIVNTLNGHFYIGSAVDLYHRKVLHFSDLRKSEHHSRYFQNAYNLYGADAFRFVIIEYVEVAKDLIEREQHYIDTLNPEYNIRTIANSNLGIKFSEEVCRNMSESRKGKKLSPESIIKREATRRAKREADPTYSKPRKPSHWKGKTHSETTKAKIRATLTGYEHTEEARRNIGESHKGNTNAKGNKGKPKSPESIAKREATKRAKYDSGELASPMKGKKQSPESIAKRTATRTAKREADPAYGKWSKKKGDH